MARKKPIMNYTDYVEATTRTDQEREYAMVTNEIYSGKKHEYFKSFNFKGKYDIEEYISRISFNEITEPNLRDLLSTENINFVLIGINRLQSTILCEEGFSYVQQSQRYTPVEASSMYILENTPEELYMDAFRLNKLAINLYKTITELNDPNKKGRLSREDFKYGILYEEARCILPLCVTTNISVTMSGDKLIDLYKIFNKYPHVFAAMRYQLDHLLTNGLVHALNRVSNIYIEKDTSIMDDYFRNKYKNLCNDRNVIKIENDPVIENITIGALTSQNQKSPFEIYDSWGVNKVENSKKLISNVLSYGHYGILEQGRTTFAMQCSLSTYHQVIRHRLQNIRREPLIDIAKDINREYIIPDSIKASEFLEDVEDIIRMYKELYTRYIKKVDDAFIIQFLLNCAPVKFLTSSNIRNDNWIFRERLCFTAQKEIRDMYDTKFMIMNNKHADLIKLGIPPCVTTGKCKEGKLCCGYADLVNELYKDYI